MSPFWTNALIDVLLVIYVIDCMFMGLIIMMQRSKQEGLGAAFGGGFTDSIWGAQTSNVLVKGTVWAAIIFFVLSVTLARLYSQQISAVPTVSPIQQELTAPVPSSIATPTTPTTNASVQPIAPPATTSAISTVPATAPAPAKAPASK